MKKMIGLCLTLFLFTGLYSQVTLNFCASVESNGYCNLTNTKFIASPDSTHGRIFMEVHGIDRPIGASNILFKIYRVGKDGSEKFETMLQQTIQPDWYFAWMPFNFESPAKYNVKIYNEKDEVIVAKSFELIAFK